MANCEHDKKTFNAPDEVMDGLPECQRQSSRGRHKCAVAAYHTGYEEGLRDAWAAVERVIPRTREQATEMMQKKISQG